MENLKCINCSGNITRPKAKKFCSHTCYERYTSKVKYYKNHEKTKACAKSKNEKRNEIGYYAAYREKQLTFVEENGITGKILDTYGITFLKENPLVLETLKLIELAKRSKILNQSAEDKSEYKKSYYQKNKEKIKERSKQYRLNKKLNKKETI